MTESNNKIFELIVSSNLSMVPYPMVYYKTVCQTKLDQTFVIKK